jgi:hypothetical protein
LGDVVSHDRNDQRLSLNDPKQIACEESWLDLGVVVLSLAGEKVRDVHTHRTKHVMHRAPTEAMQKHPPVVSLSNGKRRGAIVMGWATRRE